MDKIGGMITREQFRDIVAMAFHEDDNPNQGTELWCDRHDHPHPIPPQQCEQLANLIWAGMERAFLIGE